MKPTNLFLASLALLLMSDIVVADTTIKTTFGDCSPIIANNTGNVTFICGASEELTKKLNNLLSVKKYNQLVDEFQNQKTSLADVRQRLKHVSAQSEDSKLNLEKQEKNIEEQLKEMNGKIENANLVMVQGLKELPEIISKDIVSTIAKEGLEIHHKQIAELNLRVANLETWATKQEQITGKLTEDMEAFKSGKLDDFLLSVGGSLGGSLMFQKQKPFLDRDYLLSYGVDVDVILPSALLFKQNSIFFEARVVKWQDNMEFPTLPGMPGQPHKENNDMVYLAVGSKLYFLDLTDDIMLYVGGAAGGSIKQETTPYAAMIFGAEYAFYRTRISLELRWDNYFLISQKDFDFDPFGTSNSNTDPMDEVFKSGFQLGARLLFEL